MGWWWITSKERKRGRDSTVREEGMFLSFPPIEGAIDAVQLLLGDPRFDVYFVSTAPWSNPSAWTDKRLWLEQHFGEGVKKRLVLTHRKDLVVGDVLIDDRPTTERRNSRAVGCILGAKKCHIGKR